MLNIKSSGIYVDATTGGAGHSSRILEKLTTGHLYCFDQDDYALKRASERLSAISDNYTLIKANFVDLEAKLKEQGVTKIDGIIYDLGVSSFQFDIPERGFSYNYDAPLDMRMDQSQELSAKQIVNEYPFNELVKIFIRYGEDKNAKYIARKIEEVRKTKEIETTFQLVDIIKSALPAKVLNKKGHPAKKVFQALRIAVNDELQVFEKSITQALDMLNIDGRAVVISFHSLEDRICKTIFREYTTSNLPDKLPVLAVEDTCPYKLITRKPICASEEELEYNNRAHSAKMRVITKVS